MYRPGRETGTIHGSHYRDADDCPLRDSPATASEPAKSERRVAPAAHGPGRRECTAIHSSSQERIQIGSPRIDSDGRMSMITMPRL